MCIYIIVNLSADSLSPLLYFASVLRFFVLTTEPGERVKRTGYSARAVSLSGLRAPNVIIPSFARSSRQGKLCSAKRLQAFFYSFYSPSYFKMYLFPCSLWHRRICKVHPAHTQFPNPCFSFFFTLFHLLLNQRTLGIIKTLRACLYHKYLWKAHGAILPDYSYLLNWVKCNAIPKTAFRMKEKACKARDNYHNLGYRTGKTKEHNAILCCVCCVSFCFVLFHSLCWCTQTCKYSMVCIAQG